MSQTVPADDPLNHTSDLVSEIADIQQFLHRKRRLNFGNDILDYIVNPDLVEPEYICIKELPENPVLIKLRKRKQKHLVKVQAQARAIREREKIQTEERRGKYWKHILPDPQQVAIDKGNEALVEPLRLEREQKRQAEEEAERIRKEWERKEAKVQPYVDEIKAFGEPRHRIYSQFWVQLLGAEVCEKNIKVIDESADDVTTTPKTDKESKETSQQQLQEQKKDRKKSTKIKKSENERLREAVIKQRENELTQIALRNKKIWHPTKATKRPTLRYRFNNPPKPKLEKPIKPKSRELTELEKRQLQAKYRHMYEQEHTKNHREKFYRPGALTDISGLLKLKPEPLNLDEFENTEHGRFLNRYITRRFKAEVQNCKWHDIIYPRSPEREPGLKVFQGFTPIPELVNHEQIILDHEA